MTRSTPSTFTSNIVCQSAGSAVEIGSAPTAPPATLTSNEHDGTACASAATESASVTSTTIARPPISSATAPRRSARRAAQTTSKPSCARRRAVAAPMPLLAPVTTAVRRPGVGSLLMRASWQCRFDARGEAGNAGKRATGGEQHGGNGRPGSGVAPPGGVGDPAGRSSSVCVPAPSAHDEEEVSVERYCACPDASLQHHHHHLRRSRPCGGAQGAVRCRSSGWRC